MSGVLAISRERALILALLLALAAAAWVVVIRQATGPGAPMAGELTMGMAAPVFLATWVAMMVAMMFPAAAPMVLTFTRVYAGKRRQGQGFVPTWVFVGAYLLVWALCGVAAYAAALGAESLARHSAWVMAQGARLGGIVIIAAGLYQLSPLKQTCLARCRTPLQFVLTSWRDGYGGAFRMGLQHGAVCLGCCWLLFAILFPLGVMNVAAMALLTALIFAEKALPMGPHLARLAAAALVGYGALVLAVPQALPGAM